MTLLCVDDDPDDLEKVLADGTDKEAPPKRIFARKITLRENLADDGDFRVRADLRLAEIAAFDERDAHRAKVVVIGVADIGVTLLACSVGVTPFNIEFKVGRLSGEWKLGHQTNCLNARQCRDSLLQLLEKEFLLLRR